MFKSNGSMAEAGSLAALQIKLWEKALSFRITLQKGLDISSHIPLIEDSSLENASDDLHHSLSSLLVHLQTLLDDQLAHQNDNNKRRKVSEVSWESLQLSNERHKLVWKDVLNKWHSRINFGSSGAVSKMKTFKQTLWDQIQIGVENGERDLQKSRMPWSESKRLNKEIGDKSPSHDLEVYDDRLVYSMLLKAFTSQSTQPMLAEDMEALRRLKKAKANVDRKATKGRRIRYIVHRKLQNFMFPIPSASSEMDSEKLFQSLFQ